MLKTLNKWIKTSTPWQTILRFLMVLLTTFTSLIVFFSIITIAPPAQAATACVPNSFYASEYQGDPGNQDPNKRGLFIIDIRNGTPTQVGTLSTTTVAISRDSITGRIFYVSDTLISGQYRLYSFDPLTGSNNNIAPLTPEIDPALPNPNEVTAVVLKMAQRADGTIYIASSDNKIYTVNPVTGKTRIVASITTIPPAAPGPVIGSGDMAFNPNSINELFVTVRDPGTGALSLYSVNVSNGTFSVRFTTPAVPGSNSTAFGPDGKLYVNRRNGANSELIEIDTATGGTVGLPLNIGTTEYSDFGTLPTLTPEVNVNIEKTTTSAAVLPGSPVTYTIKLTNVGSCDISGIRLDDTAVPTLSNISWSSTVKLAADETIAGTGSITPASGNSNITNALVNLNVGSRLIVTLTGTVDPASVGPINLVNTVTATPPEGINFRGVPPGSPITATATTPILGPTPLPDLDILKTGSANYTPGGNITYNLRVSNIGNANATNRVRINDPTPPGATFVSLSGATCTPVTPPTAFPCDMTVPFLGTNAIPRGEVRNLMVTFTASPSVSGALSNTAEVESPDEIDPADPGRLLLRNNRSTFVSNPPASPPPFVPPIVPPVVDVAIGVTAPPSVPPGSTFNVTLTARNLGTANADNVTVSYDVPPGVTVVSVPDGCVYNATASTIVCASIPSFSRGATTNYNFVFKAPDTPISLTGIARISTTSAEPNTGNNSAAATTTVATDAPNPNPPTDPNTGLPIIPLIPIIPPPSPLPLIPSIIGTTLQINNPPTNNRNGTETVQFTVTITNTSTQPLSDLQAIIDLVRTFSGVQGFVVVSVDSSNFVINPAFNGTDLQNLLGAGNILNPGATGQITFRVQVTPGINTGPYFASVTVRGTDPNGNVVSDVSTDGTIADANGNGTTSDDNTPTTIQFTGLPNIRLVKRMTNAFRNGVAVSGIDFNTLINDANDVNDDAPGWANLSPLGLVRIGETGLLQSGDQLEYTVYFLSDGTGTADNFLFCDPTPAGASFLGDTYGTGLGSLLRLDGVETPQTNATDTDAGRFIPPLTPAPSPCPSPNNPNGAVYMQIPRVSNRSPNNVGFVRFRVLLQ